MIRFLVLLSFLIGANPNIILLKRNFTHPAAGYRPRSYTELRDGVVLTSKTLNFDRNDVKITKVKLCPVCKCGVTSKNRIVGGEVVSNNKYSWMAAMTYYGRYYCVASLINDRYAITAGHCTNGFQKKHLQIHFFNHTRDNGATLRRDVAVIKRFRGYNAKTLNNDISLIKLSSKVPLNDNLRPICLPEIGNSWSGYEGIVAGWGAKRYKGKPSTKLFEVSIPIMTNALCRQTVYGARITRNMLCAGYLHGGKDACQGDSGGPLMVVNETVHYLAGIVSWGAGCGARGRPGVYTRVAKYIEWIENNTRDSCYCDE